MNDNDVGLQTVNMRTLIDRGRAGDRSAFDQLIREAASRLERLARAMLRRFPSVRSQADTGDVLQGALVRLWRSLQSVQPANTREFYGLAAEQIRRELLDLTRHFRRRVCLVEQLPSDEPIAAGGEDSNDDGSGSEYTAEEDLEQWGELHEAVASLPTAEREVFGLRFYHGWTEEQIAELLQVSERQVRRRWASAMSALSTALGRNFDSEPDAAAVKSDCWG